MVDYPTIALLPWLIMEDEIGIGEVHFVPWNRRANDSKVPFMSQECTKSIMSIYRDTDGRMIDKAVLAYHSKQGKNGMISTGQLEEISEASQILAFSALAERQYFPQVAQNESINSAYFRTIFQRFQEPFQDISYQIKLIEQPLLIIKKKQSFKRSKPLQCAVKPVDNYKFKYNKRLMKALYDSRSGNDRCKRLKGAIVRYLAATQCDDWITHEQEYTDLIIAYESLFSKTARANKYSEEISRVLEGYGRVRLKDSSWVKEKTAVNKRQSDFLHSIFLDESYKLRNKYAHGGNIEGMQIIWTERNHYIFGCWMFPLVIKKILHDEGYYVLNEDDEIYLQSIDKLLDCKNWEESYRRGGKSTNITNWQHVLEETRGHLAKNRAIERYRELN